MQDLILVLLLTRVKIKLAQFKKIYTNTYHDNNQSQHINKYNKSLA